MAQNAGGKFASPVRLEPDGPNRWSGQVVPFPMASAPGEKAVYCSSNPNLALGVVGRATGEFPLDTFDRLLGDDPKAPVVPREDYVSPYGRSEVSGPVSPPK